MVCHSKGNTHTDGFREQGAEVGFWTERGYHSARCHRSGTKIHIRIFTAVKNLKYHELYIKICLHLRVFEGAQSKLKSVLRQRHLLLVMSLCAECIAMLEQLAGCCWSLWSRPAREESCTDRTQKHELEEEAASKGSFAGVWWKSRWTQTWWMLKMNGRRWDTEGETEKRCDGTIGCCRNMSAELHREEMNWVTNCKLDGFFLCWCCGLGVPDVVLACQGG